MQQKGYCDYSQDNRNDFSENTYDYSEYYDLLKKGHNETFENLLIAHMEANKGGLRSFIIKLKENLPAEYLERFANKCVCEYIKIGGKYGYFSSGMNNVFENYYMYFDVNSWNLLLKSIIDRHYDDNLYTVSIAAEDIEIFTLYYLLAHHPEQLEAEYSALCEVHEALVTANGRIPKKKYSLVVDSSIKSLTDLVRFQLNCQ